MLAPPPGTYLLRLPWSKTLTLRVSNIQNQNPPSAEGGMHANHCTIVYHKSLHHGPEYYVYPHHYTSLYCTIPYYTMVFCSIR